MRGLLGLALLVSASAWCRQFVQVQAQVQSGETIHKALVDAILAAPLSFFESNPSGRLLQRFSHDLNLIDSNLATNLGSVITTGLAILGSASTIIAANPVAFIFFFPLGFVYTKYMNLFRPVVRELKRLEGRTRAPGTITSVCYLLAL